MMFGSLKGGWGSIKLIVLWVIFIWAEWHLPHSYTGAIIGTFMAFLLISSLQYADEAERLEDWRNWRNLQDQREDGAVR